MQMSPLGSRHHKNPSHPPPPPVIWRGQAGLENGTILLCTGIIGSRGRILQPGLTQRLELKTVQLAEITGRCCLPELDGQGELRGLSQPDLRPPALRSQPVGLVVQLSPPLIPIEIQQILPPRRTSSGPFRGISYSGIQPSNNQYHSSEIG